MKSCCKLSAIGRIFSNFSKDFVVDLIHWPCCCRCCCHHHHDWVFVGFFFFFLRGTKTKFNFLLVEFLLHFAFCSQKKKKKISQKTVFAKNSFCKKKQKVCFQYLRHCVQMCRLILSLFFVFYDFWKKKIPKVIL